VSTWFGALGPLEIRADGVPVPIIRVRHLLPGTTGCVVVVTSRDRLAGLAARYGARRLAVSV
jgi:hypothetical protein